jgi:hypothetical protein
MSVFRVNARGPGEGATVLTGPDISSLYLDSGRRPE